jgi:predicted nucleic acid-binding protein
MQNLKMLADTTLLIDLLKGKKEAVELVKKHEQKGIYTTEINVFELVRGAYRTKQEDIHDNLVKILVLIARLTVLPVERKASLKAGEIAGKSMNQGKIIEDTDFLIAGTALAHGIQEIITENKKHFGKIPDVKVITYADA